MNRSIRFFRFSLFAVVALASIAARAGAESHVRGRITGESGEPIDGARVEASYRGFDMPPFPPPPDGRADAEGHTGPDGRYDLVLEFPGCYLVRAGGSGYQISFYPGVAEEWNATCVEVLVDAAVEGIDLSLRPAGAISGRVTDARTGEALRGAVVAAWSASWDSTGGGTGGDPDGDPDGDGHGWAEPDGRWGEGIVRTDSTGAYWIDGLAEGEYFVYAEAQEHVGEYFDDARTLEDARRIAVAPSHTATGIDLALGRGGCISGRVRSEDGGAPIEGAFVSIGRGFDGGFGGGIDVGIDGGGEPLPSIGDGPPDDDPPPLPGWGAVTGPDGTYHLCGLTPGEYNVGAYAEGFLPEFFEDAACWNEADPIAVAEEDEVAGVDFTLVRGGKIEGRVTSDAGFVAGASVQAWSAVGDSTVHGDPWECWIQSGGFATADSAGHYVIAGLPSGNFVVLAEAPDFLPTFYGGGQDPRHATPVVVTAPAATTGIDIVLDRGGSISGRVSDEATGAPIAQAWVELYLPGNDGGTDPAGGRYPGAVTDESGAYRISGVPSGAYLLLASGWDLGFDPEFYRDAGTPDEATPVAVAAPAETPSIDFSLGHSAPIDGAIVGRVVAGESGEPLASAVVTAISLAGNAGVGVTDGEGFYWIASLPAGDYVVLAAAPGRIGTFYNQALSWEEATPVAVEGPVRGIDFALGSVGSGTGVISGRITDADGTGIAQAWVYAEAEDGSGARGFTTSGAGGQYVLGGLVPGRYHVRATRSGMADAYHESFVAVANGVVPDVDVVLAASVAIAPGLHLEPSVPNPFRDAATIRLLIDRAPLAIDIDIYDVAGRHVRRLAARSERAGRQELPWDGRDANGVLLPSGVYIYHALAAGKAVSGRLVLLR